MASGCPVQWADEVGCVGGRHDHACSHDGNDHHVHPCSRCNAYTYDDWTMSRSIGG